MAVDDPQTLDPILEGYLLGALGFGG